MMRSLLCLVSVLACSSSEPFVPCPTAAPVIGSDCASYNPSICEYGTSADPSCNASVACQYVTSQGPEHGHWASVANGACPATSGNPSTCPASRGDVPVGSTCSPEGLTCDYPRAACGCRQQFEGTLTSFPTWRCVDLAPECPTTRPLLGSPCPTMTTSSIGCDYGDCLDPDHIAVACMSGGGWELAGGECMPPGG